jgi:hypothetical protein
MEGGQHTRTGTNELGAQRDASFSGHKLPDHPPYRSKDQDKEIRERIDALKQRSESRNPDRNVFCFDPSEPLKLTRRRT